jgi:hypothetical protein
VPTACGPHPVNIAGGPTNVHPYVSAVGPTQFRKPLREPGQLGLCLRIVFAVRHQHADPPHPLGPLRPRRERPRDRGTAEPLDELAAFHVEHGGFLPRSVYRTLSLIADQPGKSLGQTRIVLNRGAAGRFLTRP